jgi:O-acetyl-ADP-ribose deacetylase (regulator of RNase III)
MREGNAAVVEVEIEVAPGRVLALARGDITGIAADAIVNASNSALAGGGGVDGAIHRAGGPTIMAELRGRYGGVGCPTGSAVMTGAGNLPARWVIHAVGPIWRGGGAGEADLLASAYRTALRLADEAGSRSITLPAISCGVYGYPLDAGARIGVDTVAVHLAGAAGSVERATFVLFSAGTFEAFREALIGRSGA